MEQRIFILILIIFLLTTNYSTIFKDITKSLFYLIIIFGIVKIINPSWLSIFKNNTIDFVKTDGGSSINYLSKIASYIKGFITTTFKINLQKNIQPTSSSQNYNIKYK